MNKMIHIDEKLLLESPLSIQKRLPQLHQRGSMSFQKEMCALWLMEDTSQITLGQWGKYELMHKVAVVCLLDSFLTYLLFCFFGILVMPPKMLSNRKAASLATVATLHTVSS